MMKRHRFPPPWLGFLACGGLAMASSWSLFALPPLGSGRFRLVSIRLWCTYIDLVMPLVEAVPGLLPLTQPGHPLFNLFVPLIFLIPQLLFALAGGTILGWLGRLIRGRRPAALAGSPG